MEEGASLPVAEWLRALHLDQYLESFEKNDLWKVSDCRNLTDGALTQIGILLPGHRKRILFGLQKAFMETPPATEGPVVAARRPVPMKRNIFRVSTDAVTTQAEPELKGDSATPASRKSPLPTELENPAGLSQVPPPIPPRLGCRPPVKFSSASCPVSAELSPAVPCRSEPPSFTDFAPPLPAPLPARDKLSLGPVVPEGKGKPPLPPLPLKRHQLETKPLSLKVPPLPSRPPLLPPRALSQRTGTSFPDREECQAPEPVPIVPPPLPPVLPPLKPQQESPPELPSRPVDLLLPEFDDSDYEEPPWEEELAAASGEMSDKDDAEIMRGRLRSERINSLFSEDELIEDYYDQPAANDSSCWNDYGLSTLQSSGTVSCSSSMHSGSTEGLDASAQLLPIIKAGWLDKNPPQGSYIYQRRWVKLDADYLRYFDSEKDTYSKRFIPVTSIVRVASIGDQKFEVITNSRTFAFRAESDADRNEWMRTLQQMVDERKFKGLNRISLLQPPTGALDSVDKCGLLELRGFKNKLYVVVAGEKVFLYKNAEDYRQGIGITYIEMNVGNVKDVDRRGFDLTTPYRIFSFSADSDQEKDEWVEAMQQSIAEALSNSEVAEKIWSVEANRFCADCGSPKPDWASVNLCVVICKRCAGEHRGLGPSITKVRSLKMDRKVWTEELIELFCQVGNSVANQFWAANVPPSEAIHVASGSQERRRFLIAKYKEGKYRRYHPLFGNQEELNKALCATVTTSDLAETQSLVFCGAEVSCFSGDPDFPNPIALAEQAGQKLQMEFLLHNKNSEIPRVEAGSSEEKHYSVILPSVTHNGFLYKTPSMAKLVHERKSREEFSRRWCTLNDSIFSYYENDRNAVPNGEIKMEEIVCLVNNPPDTHGFESTFEVYIESERLYLFGLDNPEAIWKWVKSIAKSFIHPRADELLSHDFERIGRLQYKGGLNLERAKEGWFALSQSVLYAFFEDSDKEETVHLKKLQELSIQGDSLVLVERRRTLYIQGERKLDFLGWVAAIQKAAGSSGDTLSEQQLTESDIPVIVDRCIDYITQCGLTSEGIYRKSGQNSKITSLLEMLRKDARRVRLKEGEHHVDDVSNTLKRFFRDLGDGLFTKEFCQDWLKAAAVENEEEKIGQYRQLLSSLPVVNRATVKALINHLYRVQYFSEMNQMNTHNLAIVFGPTLFQTDGKDYKAGRVVEDLISRYVVIFSVDEQEMRKQQDEIQAIIKMRIAGSSSGTQQAGDFICTVYLEEKKTEAEQHIKIPATMTAEELTFEILDRRKIETKEKEYWSCFEVNEREEAERPLHYSEKVLPILHGLGTDSYLVVKKQLSMENMLIYLASRVSDSKHGMMKFREERNLLGLGLSTGFHDRYFILNNSCLRLYKEVRSVKQRMPAMETSHRPEKEWPVKNLKVYLGIKKKLRPPSCWGFTVFYENEKHEKQQWYLCCDTQMELREWFASFLYVQNGGNVWPSESSKVRASRTQQDSRLGNISLIPLRGNENEMRNSVAAFAADPLTLLRNV
ncbi:arf-GAP with Rho-GAP domain, ANK repeat and PH domain-containing protein 1 isoform X1 [Gopherus evgoodei]|uniref:ArfGAP with RhoGAP domain, ankyrin repeat and PH domain 1 n=2 Tax=Gopherus evgoodei TaxID=1825980 RepID=A0A8C4VNZ6_9SAUR|nr:arf-GAP with Rho-GAP domain, ANK repeat and PH domain-containing protein 1 isoform X1 [Gopherus evgoodei]XP_030412336.1 arf-GAP with Rho-GAP domain, ANK repeat and PH domain-containing protein 1 isoform X1 [Gopherus evgoodei]XP_030412345.1 arf-GAP with Rho-GAP domain, ANK repeat and PH domain-containing protein 1 isoform X1 [Gopherus evgoodei]XP_030412355.1 arf-GAP with Rho-GAP domain, ANK repeat and PH domain-containing protein 1 isoform X1 [Gopherus evgoodei]